MSRIWPPTSYDEQVFMRGMAARREFMRGMAARLDKRIPEETQTFEILVDEMTMFPTQTWQSLDKIFGPLRIREVHRDTFVLEKSMVGGPWRPVLTQASAAQSINVKAPAMTQSIDVKAPAMTQSIDVK